MNIEIRASKDDSAWELEGYATTYGSPYPVRDGNGAYAETITRGCFAGAVSGRDSVELRVEHNRMAPPLASTAARSGTMTLADDATGLLLRATLPKDDPDNQAAVSKAARGLLDRMSVGFSDAVSAWSKDRSRRAIRSARLVEVSLCGAPSNPGAVVTSVRAEGTAEELEVRYSPSGLAVVERAAKYSATEIEALGQAGKAFKAANGIYDYPAADRADVLAGIHRVGSAEPADKAPLRRFLTGRAKALGASRLIPLNVARGRQRRRGAFRHHPAGASRGAGAAAGWDARARAELAEDPRLAHRDAGGAHARQECDRHALQDDRARDAGRAAGQARRAAEAQAPASHEHLGRARVPACLERAMTAASLQGASPPRGARGGVQPRADPLPGLPARVDLGDARVGVTGVRPSRGGSRG